MSVIEKKYRAVFEALLNPSQISRPKLTNGTVSYVHIEEVHKAIEREYLINLHDFILSEPFLEFQEEKLQLLLGMFIFRNPFDTKERPFYLLGSRESFKSKLNEHPSFILQPHYYETQPDGTQSYQREPFDFIEGFLKINLEDRQKNAATAQDFFIHIEDTSKLSRFEQEQELYYVPSGEFDFCLLQWITLELKRAGAGPFTLGKTYPLIRLLSYKHPDIGRFLEVNEELTMPQWFEKLGLTIDAELTERGKALMYWANRLCCKDNQDTLFSVNVELFELYSKLSLVGKKNGPEDLLPLLNQFADTFGANEDAVEQFARRCRFRLPIHFIMRYKPRKGRVETASRGLFALNAFRQRLPDNESGKSYENVGFYLGLFRDATDDGRNYALLGEDPDVNNKFKSVLNNYKLLIKILGEIEFREVYQKNVLLKQLIDLRNEALRSAIASVMARCLSHYNGSHILPDIRNYFSKLKVDEFDGNAQEALVQYLDFLQYRMELIADLTVAESTTSGFPFDIFPAIVKPFQSYLRNAGLGLFDAFNTNQSNNVHISLLYDRDVNERRRALMRGGQLGISAIYLILENIIRNYYKHAKKVRNRNYKFQLEINEPEDEQLAKKYWCVDLFDLHGDINTEKRSVQQNNAFQMLATLQKHIDDPVIDDRGRLRNYGMGFIEMKAACCYILNFALTELDTFPKRSFPASLLEVAYYNIDPVTRKMTSRYTSFDAPVKQFNLGFRFYIKKVKSLLIDQSAVVKGAQVFRQKGGLAPRFWGIDIEPLNKFTKELSENRRTDHEIVVTNKVLPSNNQRQAKTTVTQYQDLQKLEKQCWEAYTDTLSHLPVKIFNYDPQLMRSMNNYINVAIDDHGSSFHNFSFAEIRARNFDAYFVQSVNIPSFPKDVVTCTNRPELEKQVDCRQPYRVKETALLRISIFDERIQNDAGKKRWSFHRNLTMRDLHELGGVYIPAKPQWAKHTYNVEPVDLDNMDGANRERVRVVLEQRLAKDHYVIVHYTLFEKLIREGETPEGLATALSERHPFKLVFCSGSVRKKMEGGKHLFVNLSTLQNVLINRPSKFELVNILKSL